MKMWIEMIVQWSERIFFGGNRIKIKMSILNVEMYSKWILTCYEWVELNSDDDDDDDDKCLCAV